MDAFYDEEAVYQEADILQAQYETEARQLEADVKAGICHHSGRYGYRRVPFYAQQEGLEPGQWRCMDVDKLGCTFVGDTPICESSTIDNCDLPGDFNAGMCEACWIAEEKKRWKPARRWN